MFPASAWDAWDLEIRGKVSTAGHWMKNIPEKSSNADWNWESISTTRQSRIRAVRANSLSAGRLSRKPGDQDTKRAVEDAYAKFKYDATAQQDNIIIERVCELASKRGASMTEISLAWLLSKVTSPVVGATKMHHVEGAVKAVDLELTEEEKAYLEEPYVPHPLAGVMAQNRPAAV